MTTNPPPALPDQLLDIARDMREVYLRMLDSAIGTTDTAGACFYACVLLRTAIGQFTPLTPVVRGGDGVLDGGYTDFLGQRHGHYWVEACDAEGQAWVVDITADQFEGGPPVVVVPVSYSRPRYLPGDQATVDQHVVEHGDLTR